MRLLVDSARKCLFYKDYCFYTFWTKTGACMIGLPINTHLLGFMAAISADCWLPVCAGGRILQISISSALTAHICWSKVIRWWLWGGYSRRSPVSPEVHFSYYWNLPSGPALCWCHPVWAFCWHCCSARLCGILTRLSQSHQPANQPTAPPDATTNQYSHDYRLNRNGDHLIKPVSLESR